jgi:hypothetical protein
VTTSRILVPITYGLSVRYLHPTGVLDGLRTFSDPVVGLGWPDAELAGLLRGEGFEVIELPAASLQHDYRMYRRRLDVLHQRRLATPTRAVLRGLFHEREQLFVRAVGNARRAVDTVLVRRPGGAAAVEAGEPDAVERWTNLRDFRAVLADRSIDAVMSVTPYHDQDGLLLWAAQHAGLPTLTSVISFDNPTTRARLISRSDRILVWNRFNADEILRAYPELAPGRVGVIGAPQFDLHHRPDLVVDECTWREELSLPPDRPIVLYGAGPTSLVRDEHRIVEALDRAIGAGRIRGGPHVLVRRHPADDPAPWREWGRGLRHATVVDPWAAGSDPHRSWPSRADLVVQMSSLAHSAVHVNVCSSMTLDGAVFDRPQVGPTFVPGDPAASHLVASFYRQEHWQPIARSGGLTTAGDETELVEAVNDALDHPDRLRAERRRLVEDTLTYVDGRSSGRLVDEVRHLVGATSSSPTR